MVRALVVLAAVLVLAALAPQALALAAPTTIAVREEGCPKSYCFEPANVTVGGGDLPFVLDNSAGTIGHSLCIIVGATTSCAPGPTPGDAEKPGDKDASLTVRITEPGTYAYFCGVGGHRALGMEGSITLASASGTTPSPAATPGGYAAGKSTPGFEAGLALVALGVLGLAARRP